jgi:hypothetical protein
MLDLSWDDIADRLLRFYKVEIKEDTEMYNLWELDPNGELGRNYHKGTNRTKWDDVPGTIRRCGPNAIRIHGLVLDYDKGITLDQACLDLTGFEFVIYTTFRHTNAAHRFRVVLPFTQSLSKKEFALKLDDIRQYFPNVDRASYSTTQAIYFHSGPDPKIAIAFRNRGIMLDPTIFKDKVPPPVQTKPIQNYSTTLTTQQEAIIRATVFKSLMSCSGLRRGADEGTGGPLLTAICKGSGLSEAEFRMICNTASANDSTLRSDQEQTDLWTHAGCDQQHITQRVRDKFIMDHGGTKPVFIFPTLKQILESKFRPQKRELRRVFRNE